MNKNEKKKYIQINARLTQLQIDQIRAEGERQGIGSFAETLRYIVRVYFKNKQPR